ncbi:MAG TPA: MFS transporter [Ktedonobacteraceae bacterium]|nr:MFS transporter [Ktedonobacteraceae bacterium]
MVSFVKPPCDEGVVLSRPAAKPEHCTSSIEPWVLLATILASSMAFIDGSVVNVALPVIQVELNATGTDVQWIIEAYSLFLAALILVGGSLGDHFGRKRIFTLGIIIFTLASVVCGLSANVLQLILARAIQGIGGALLVPGSLAIISASFSNEKRGQAIGTWSGFTAITSVVGPVLGGWLVQYASWRWVFFINIPLAAIVLFVLFWRVPESRDESLKGKGLDWWGTLLVTLALGTIVYGLIQAGGLGLGHPLVLTSLAIGVVAFATFLLVESRVPTPIVRLDLFRSHTFAGANLLTLLLYAALGGLMFYLPFNLIQVQGYSATAAGAAFVPFILIMFLLSRWTGGLVTRYGAKLPLIVGPFITAIGFSLYAVQGVGGSYWTTFFPAVVVMGIGMTITVAPLTTTVMGSVDQSHAGVASGINNAISRTAGLLAIAVLGIVMGTAFKLTLENNLATLSLSPQIHQAIVAQQVKLAGISIPTGVSSATHIAIKQAIDDAFISGFRLVAFICVGLALASALCSWLLIAGKLPDKSIQIDQAPTSSEASSKPA